MSPNVNNPVVISFYGQDKTRMCTEDPKSFPYTSRASTYKCLLHHSRAYVSTLSNYIYELMRIKLKIQTLNRGRRSVKLLFYNTYNSLRYYGQLKIYIILTIKQCRARKDISFSPPGIFISSIYLREALWKPPGEFFIN